MLFKYRTCRIMVFLSISLVVLLYFTRRHVRKASSEVGPHDGSLTERTNIFFLKTHKCGSTTVQNVLLRFGLERGLTFVLPSPHNYLGSPELFSPNMIDDMYRSEDGKYNIFAHHTRYSSEGVRSVMYDDAVYVTILRHPADVYESMFSYYCLQEQFNISLQELLKYPKNAKKMITRAWARIGFNQMSWDLGLVTNHFHSSPKVKRFIKKIEKEFDLVMIVEWMEASLVLLADLMNWPLENVMFLRLNSRTSDSIYNMSDVELERLNVLNSADYKLYTHFLNKFRKRIIDYGEERMRKDIGKLLSLNINLQFICNQSLSIGVYGHGKEDKLCFFATRGEIDFTDYLKKVQKRKLKVLHNLDILLYN